MLKGLVKYDEILNKLFGFTGTYGILGSFLSATQFNLSRDNKFMVGSLAKTGQDPIVRSFIVLSALGIRK